VRGVQLKHHTHILTKTQVENFLQNDRQKFQCQFSPDFTSMPETFYNKIDKKSNADFSSRFGAFLGERGLRKHHFVFMSGTI
jgi:hypothetical protein